MKKILTILLLLCFFSAAPAQFFELTFDDTVGQINPITQMLTLAGHLKNITGDSLHFKMVRLQNNLPSALWTSSMCMGLCFPDDVDSASTMDPGFHPLAPGDSIIVDVIFFQFDTIPGVATVLVKFATMDDAQVELKWLEAHTLLTDIKNAPGFVETKFTLLNNYPNPFNNQTVISAMINTSGKVKLQIYDVLGREVYTTGNNASSPGTMTFRWHGINNDGLEMSSGIYFYRLTSFKNENVVQSQIKKLTLLR